MQPGLAIDPGRAPGGFVLRALDTDGRLLAELPTRGSGRVHYANGEFARATRNGPLIIAIYDGDSGCLIPAARVAEIADHLFELWFRTSGSGP